MSINILELQVQYQKILNTKLNKIQRDYDNSIYTNKTPLDKLTCLLCNGSILEVSGVGIIAQKSIKQS